MSEYEKALFRVYDRTLDGFWGDLLLDSRTQGSNPSANGGGPIANPCRKWCRAIEKVLIVSVLFLFVIGCHLHITFVGKPGCLEQAVIASAEGTDLVVLPNIDGNSSSDGLNEGPLEISSAAEPDYLFSAEPQILKLEESTRTNHGFKSLNVTLDDKCFGSPFTRFFVVFMGFEVTLINMLQNTLFSNGLLISIDNPEVSWWWAKQSLPPRDGYSFFQKLLLKVSAIWKGFFTFFLLSTVTSIIVRVLLSSGVAPIFGIYTILEGFHLAPDPGLLVLSYSWLGVPFQYLREQSKPTGLFILGHIMNVIVLYYTFNACQLAWSYTVYGKLMPSSMPMMLYGLMLLLEYFSLIYVRSIASLAFFPRFAALVFVSWHSYFFYVPRGFFGLFFSLQCLVLFLAMIFTIKKMEFPAFIQGEVSLEYPRTRYVELPWQCPTSGPQPQPPIWTLFIPTNARSQSVYTTTVPGRPQGSSHHRREDNGGDNGVTLVDSANDNLNEGRDEEEQQRSDDPQQQQYQTRRYTRLSQTPDDIELGATVH